MFVVVELELRVNLDRYLSLFITYLVLPSTNLDSECRRQGIVGSRIVARIKSKGCRIGHPSPWVYYIYPLHTWRGSVSPRQVEAVPP